jgi:hypothetical protein
MLAPFLFLTSIITGNASDAHPRILGDFADARRELAGPA